MDKIVVFDLDDTLYKEIEFLKSGFKFISDIMLEKYNYANVYDELIHCFIENINPLNFILSKHKIDESLADLLFIYRNHKPDIKMNNCDLDILNYLSNHYKIGLITDGRKITQYNKTKSLDIYKYFNDILVSEEFGYEKPSLEPFKYYNKKYTNKKFYYIGDNTKKDFIAPNKLDWITICLKDNGKNIHKQDFNLEQEFLPKHIIGNFNELISIIEE